MSGSQRPVSPLHSTDYRWDYPVLLVVIGFMCFLLLDFEQPRLSVSAGSAAVSSEPGTSGRCEIVGKGMMEGREGKQMEKQNREGEGRR